MKTLLLYAGQARTIADVWENHRWFLRELKPEAIFCSVADDAQADHMQLLKKAFPAARFEMEKTHQPVIVAPLEETACRSGYPRSTTPEKVLGQLWAWNQAWTFFTSFPDHEQYDCIVRVRPDTPLVGLTLPEWRIDVGGYLSDYFCATPWWDRWNGCNDRFAILGRKAAKAYFTTWQKWPKLWEAGAPLHPEQLLDISLRADGITPDPTLECYFLTVRLPSPEHPRGGYFRIEPTVLDLAAYLKAKSP